MASPLPITTANQVPGHTITEITGPVFGMTLRSRNLVSQMGARLKGMAGGEVRAMTKALEQSRLEVVAQLERRAVSVGAEAVIAMRFEVSEMADVWTEICPYGTAVRTAPTDA